MNCIGRDRGVARLYLKRTALVDDHRRGSLPARLPSRLGGASRAGPLCGILQPAPPAFLTWRANARSGLCQPANANPGSGITRAEIHLSIACKLFKETEPPLLATSPRFFDLLSDRYITSFIACQTEYSVSRGNLLDADKYINPFVRRGKGR